MSRRVRLPPESAKSFPSCLRRDRSQSSFPCSRVREQRLPDCFFQVCASSLFLLTGFLSVNARFRQLHQFLPVSFMRYTLGNHFEGPSHAPFTACDVHYTGPHRAGIHANAVHLAQESHEKRSSGWKTAQDAPPGSCPVTLPSDATFVPPYPVPTSSVAHFGLAANV